MCHCYHPHWRKLTGLSKAVQLPADSLGIDGHHADGVFSVRGQLGEQDSSFLPTHLGLVEEEKMSVSLANILLKAIIMTLFILFCKIHRSC